MTETLVLKECPYCGRTPRLGCISGSHGYYEAKHHVSCGCGLSTPSVETDNNEEGKRRATELWNSKPDAVRVKNLTEYVKALETFIKENGLLNDVTCPRPR